MTKTKEMETFLSDLTRSAFGRSYTECKGNNQCVTCGEPADIFKDEISRREFEISSMCQKCQDNIFGRGVFA